MRRQFFQKLLGMFALGGVARSQSEKPLAMQAFEFSELIGRQDASGKPWLEFLRVPALFCGVYHLAKGADDGQRPHDQDEVYYIERGRAVIRVEEQERAVQPGSIVYVPAHADHTFIRIEEDLRMLVFFSQAGG